MCKVDHAAELSLAALTEWFNACNGDEQGFLKGIVRSVERIVPKYANSIQKIKTDISNVCTSLAREVCGSLR